MTFDPIKIEDLPDQAAIHPATDEQDPDETPAFSLGRMGRSVVGEMQASRGRRARSRKGWWEFYGDPSKMREVDQNRLLAMRGDIETARVGARAIELVDEGYTEDEAIRQAKIENLETWRQENIKHYDEIAKDPRWNLPAEFQGRSTGKLESAIRGLSGSLPDMSMMWLAPPYGIAMMTETIRGAKLEEFEHNPNLPISKERQFELATASAAYQAPLELLGDMIQIRAVSGTLAAAMERGPWKRAILDLVESGFSEGATEFFQQYPDEFATILALNPDLTKDEMIEHMADLWPQLHRSAWEAGQIGALAGIILPGTGITIGLPIETLISTRQKKINAMKEQALVEAEEKLTPPEEPVDIPIFESSDEAFAFGRRYHDKEDVLKELAARRQEHLKNVETLKEQGETNLAIVEATRAQFYREALQEAEAQTQRMQEAHELEKAIGKDENLRRAMKEAEAVLSDEALKDPERKADFQQQKEELKKVIARGIRSGEIEAGSAVRSTNVEELLEIVWAEKLHEGISFEGQPGISATQMDRADDVLPAYGGYTSTPAMIIAPKHGIIGTGQAPKEVLLDPDLDVNDLRFVVAGAPGLYTFEQLENTLSRTAEEYGPKFTPGYFKNKVRFGLEQSGKFSPLQMNNVMDIMDAVAKSWAERTGNSEADWWNQWLWKVQPGTYERFSRMEALKRSGTIYEQAPFLPHDLTWNNKPISELTPDEFKEMGDHYGIDNLGPISDIMNVPVGDLAGGTIGLPGGVKGEWTFLDLLWLKANPIDPSKLSKELRVQIQQKLARTMSPRVQDELEVFNRFLFGFLSRKARLVDNELAYSVMKMRSRAEIKRLARYASDFRQRPTKANLRRLDNQIRQDYGINARGKGGLGLGVPSNMLAIAEFARLYDKNPQWFLRKDGESWLAYAERLASQIPGVGIKIAGFGAEWLEPASAWFATIDVHMARDVYDDIWTDPRDRKSWENKWKARWNEAIKKRNQLQKQLRQGKITEQQFIDGTALLPGRGNKLVRKFDEVWDQPGGQTWISQNCIARRLEPLEPKWRTASGEINPRLPDYMKEVEWIEEPSYLSMASPFYKNAVRVLEERLAEEGIDLALSPYQWMEWDQIRGRIEPHEAMYPGLWKLPRMSMEQMRAVRDAHADAGHFSSFGTRPTDWQNLVYFQGPEAKIPFEDGVASTYIQEPVTEAQVKHEFDFKEAPKIKGQRVQTYTTGNIMAAGHEVHNAGEVATLLSFLRKEAQESLYTVTVNGFGEIVEIHHYSKGAKTRSLAAPTEIAGRVLNTDEAYKTYFIHNHPSGEPSASQPDKAILRDLQQILHPAGIQVEALVLAGTSYQKFQPTGQAIPPTRIPPMPVTRRTAEIPIKGRRQLTHPEIKNLPRFTGPHDVLQIKEQMFGPEDGVMLTNMRNTPLAFVPFVRGKTARETTIDLLKAAEATNAVAAMFFDNKGTPQRTEYLNAVSQGNLGELTVIDIFQKGESWVQAKKMQKPADPLQPVTDYQTLMRNDIYFQGSPYPFYSQLQKVASQKLPGKMGVQQAKELLESWQRKGEFKKEELEYSGLLSWLDLQQAHKDEKVAQLEEDLAAAKEEWQKNPMWTSPRQTYERIQGELEAWKQFEPRISKQELLDYLATNEIQIEEIVKLEDPEILGEYESGYDITASEDQDYFYLTFNRKEPFWNDLVEHFRDMGTIQFAAQMESGELLQEIQDEYPEIWGRLKDDQYERERALKAIDEQIASDEAYKDSITQGEAYYGVIGKAPDLGHITFVSRTPLGSYEMVQVGTDENGDIVDLFFRPYEHPDELHPGEYGEPVHLGRYSRGRGRGHDTGYEIAEDAAAEHFNDNVPPNLLPQVTKYEAYKLSGGRGYIELLLQMPPAPRPKMQASRAMAAKINEMFGSDRWNDFDLQNRDPELHRQWVEVRDAAREEELELAGSNYHSPHWNEENVLAHVRGQWFKDHEGKETFFIEELQSDWHQEGRRQGYRGAQHGWRFEVLPQVQGVVDPDSRLWEVHIFNMAGRRTYRLGGFPTREDAERAGMERIDRRGVPDAPFKQTWPLIAFKHVMDYAIKNGAEQIAWTPGVLQVDRWSTALRERVDDIEWVKAEAKPPSWLPEGVDPTKVAIIPWEQWNRQYWRDKGYFVYVPGYEQQANTLIDNIEDNVRSYPATPQRDAELAILISAKQDLQPMNGWMAIDEAGDILTTQYDPNDLRNALARSVPRVQITANNEARGTVFSDHVPLWGQTQIRGRNVDLDGLIGRELAKQIRDSSKENGSFRGEELTIGGEGMKQFYDVNMRKQIENYTKTKADRTFLGPDLQVKSMEEAGVEMRRPYSDYNFVTMRQTQFGEEPYGYHTTREQAEQYREQKLKERSVWRIPVSEKMQHMVHQGQPYFQDKQRGAVEFLRENGPAIIHAFESADITTPIHEIGHILLEMLRVQGDKDWQTICEWLQADPQTTLTRDQREVFARGFERYIMEGRAPSAKLKTAFQNLKEWMLSIYKSITRLNVKLNDDVRDVFDRMLTTEQERQADPLLDVEEWMNIDDISQPIPVYEGSDYDDIQAEAKRRAVEKVKKRREKAEKKNRRQFLKQAQEVVREIPIYKLMQDVVDRGGFNLESTLRDYDRDDISALNKKRPGLFTKKGSLKLDEIAQEYGYEYDNDLMEVLRDTPTMKEATEKQVDDLMEEYGEYIEAEDAEIHLQFLEEEAKILARMTGKYRPQATKGIKRVIREKTNQLRVNELEKVISAKDAMRTLMRRLQVETRKAYQAGAREKALELVEKQRAHMIQIRERARARKRKTEMLEKLRKIHKTKGIPYEYTERLIDLLAPYALQPMSRKRSQSLGSTRAWLDQMEAAGEDVQLPKKLLDDLALLDLKSYKDMTLEELEMLYDAAEAIIHQGKTKNQLLAAKEARDFEKTVGGILQTIYEKNPLRDPGFTETPEGRKYTRLQQASAFAKQYLAALKKVEFITKALDGFEDMGKTWSEIFRPVVEAEREELGWGAELMDRIQQAFVPFKKGGRHWAKQQYTFEWSTQPWTKENLIMVALNTGNEGNLKALGMGMRRFNKTGEPLTPEQINEMTSKLTKEEWQLVNEIWDIFESMYPRLNEAYKTLYGRPLKKVEGRYFPLVVNRDLAWRIEKKSAEEEAREYFHSIYGGTPAAKTGSIIERRGTALPPRLDFGVIFKKVTETAHYATHAVPVRDVNKILSDPRFREAVINTHGEAVYNQFTPWLREVAMPRREPLSQLEKIFRRVRNNTTTVMLGLKLTVAQKQLLSVTQTMDELGVMPVLRAMERMYTNWGDAARFVREKSVFMAQRRTQWDRELATLYRDFNPAQFKGSSAARNAYFSLIGFVDGLATLPSWLAAYDVGMSKFENDEGKAIEYADSVVRRTQPVAGPKDFAAVQRGGELPKMLTMFYTFFSVFQNRMMESYNRYRLGNYNTSQMIRSFWLLVVTPALLGALLSMRKPEEWTPEAVAKYAAREMTGFMAAGLPVVRDVASATLSGFDYNISPVEEAGRSASYFFKEVGKLAPGGDEPDPRKILKHGIMVGGYAIGFPARQAVITLEGILDLAEGNTTNPARLLYPESK